MSAFHTPLQSSVIRGGLAILIAMAGVGGTPASAQQAADWVVPSSPAPAARQPAASTPPAPPPDSPAEDRGQGSTPNAAPDAPAAADPQAPIQEEVATDTSEQVLLADRALADAIFDAGPLSAYSAAISDSGVIFDGNGGAPEGVAGVTQRFSTFPDGVKLDRRPVAAVASGSAGSSWGTYAVRRGDQVLTEGHYLTSWRREPDGWRIVTELAAGRSVAQAAPSTLPRTPDGPRPASARRTTPAAPAATGTQLPDVPMRDALGRPVAPPATTPPATTPPAQQP